MSNYAQFTNFNFKLAVIQSLMYNKKIMGTPFNIYKFAKTNVERKIDIEEEGYEIIPEAKAYFEQLQIPSELLELITEIDMDGGDEIYQHLYPFWDGECDIFNIQSAEDADLLPNLQSITLIYDKDDSILKAFRAKGIEADWL